MLLRVSKAVVQRYFGFDFFNMIFNMSFNDVLRLHYWKISLSDLLQVISRNIAVEVQRRFCAFIFDSVPHPLFLESAIYLNCHQ